MKRTLLLPLTAFLMVACGDTPTDPKVDGVVPSLAQVDDADCSLQNNNTIKKLTACVTFDGVRAHQLALQEIADANGGTRAAGTPGYDESAGYVADLLEAAGYSVTRQPFDHVAYRVLGASTFEQTSPLPQVYVEGVDYRPMTYTAAGDVTAAVTPVDLALGLSNSSTSGCEAADFAGFPVGDIALLQRGTCDFFVKAAHAEAAGAVGVIIFNQGNTPSRTGLIFGTLGSGHTGTIPVVEATYGIGETLVLAPGTVVRLSLDVDRTVVTSENILAETRGGAGDNVVMAGGHLDSVDEGPGINDNGSGVAALLETALQMARVNPRNQVRFAFWGSEEAGLVGSNHYMNNASTEERESIALYLNFDMIGSPNFAYFVYDGDGSAFGLVGPEGSAAIEATFEDFYVGRGLPYEPTQISFRSDYAAFFDAGIPFGGLFTGAEGVKTAGQVALYGGIEGEQFDQCYHLACDTYDNVSFEALDVNADAVATAILQFAMSTEAVNGRRGKGNFGARPMGPPPGVGPSAAAEAVR